MQKHEIRLNYQQATQLAQVGRFDEALEILVELDEVKPNTENILYLMAACQAKAGRKEEALKLCERLIDEFNNEHAGQMKKRLTKKASPLDWSKAKRIKKSTHSTQTPDIGTPQEQYTPELSSKEDGEDKSKGDSSSDLSWSADDIDIPTPSTGDSLDSDSDTREPEENLFSESDPVEDWDEGEAAKDSSDVRDDAAQEHNKDGDREPPPIKGKRPLWLILLVSGAAAAAVAFALLILNKYFLFL